MRAFFYLIIGLLLAGFFLPDAETPTTAAIEQTQTFAQPTPPTATQVVIVDVPIITTAPEKPVVSGLEQLGISPEKEGAIVQTVAAAPVNVVPVPAPAAVIESRFVTASALNMRDQPSTIGQVRGQARYGARLEVLEDLGDWSKVTQSGQTLWVASRYLSTTKPAVATAIPVQATAPRRNVALPTSSDIQSARNAIIRQSRASYAGSCPCPYDTDRAGRRCGGRSAWSRPGGASPICYDGDVSQSRLDTYFAQRR